MHVMNKWWLIILVVDDGSYSSEVFEISWVSDLLASGRHRDGLFQDGTKDRIAQNDSILLEIADDMTVGGEASNAFKN
jgi:hypothetical protein